MSLVPDFRNEIVENADGAVSEDLLGYFVKLKEGKEDEKLPEVQRLEALVKGQIASLTSRMKGLVKYKAQKFDNLVVQLGKSVEDTAVFAYFEDEDPVKIFQENLPTFETVIKSDKTNENLVSICHSQTGLKCCSSFDDFYF